MIKQTKDFLVEHFSEIFVGFIFLSFAIAFYVYKDCVFTKEDIKDFIMPMVVLVGFFLAWLQFLFYKYNKKKEAALTYFPRPMELEKIENEIDKVIQFWSRKDPLNTYEVKLMLGDNIDNDEYKLIWKKLSSSIKRKIIKEYNEYLQADENINSIEYDEKYNDFINEIYVDTRRKLNLYLNQVEGYCLALNKGNIDSKTSYDMFSHKFPNHYRKARTYIDMVREEKNDRELYKEFENVLRKWGKL